LPGANKTLYSQKRDTGNMTFEAKTAATKSATQNTKVSSDSSKKNEHLLSPLLKGHATPAIADPSFGNPGETADVQSILRLQHAVGNQATARILQSGGLPLPRDAQAFFERRFGRDFSQVRIHTDGEAANSAQAINARAYTIGKHVFFGTSEYVPELETGRKVIAHELAHVIQQSTNSGQGAAPGSPAMEQEAQGAMHAGALSGGRVAVSGTALTGLACLPRSLDANFDPSRISPKEIEQEILKIRKWLETHTESSSDRQVLLGSLRTLESHLPGVTAGLPVDQENFTLMFNKEFHSIISSAFPEAASTEQDVERHKAIYFGVSPEVLWQTFTKEQREKIADFMVTKRIPERLFNGANDIGHANPQQRILVSAHILTFGTYRPGSFEQRVHARYCGHWAAIVNQYAATTPARGGWPEAAAGHGVMGSFDPMGVPVLGSGGAEIVFQGKLLSKDKLPAPKDTAHEAAVKKEEEKLTQAGKQGEIRKAYRHAEWEFENFSKLQTGDWLYIYNANPSGQHSVIFMRFSDEPKETAEGVRYRRATVFNQPRPESGGREQDILLGEHFVPEQKADREKGIPYRGQINTITLVARYSTTARPEPAPAQENLKYIKKIEKQLKTTIDRTKLNEWLRRKNTEFIEQLKGRMLLSATDETALTQSNGSEELEPLVCLYQRLFALSVNAGKMEESKRKTFSEGLSAKRAEAQARLDTQLEVAEEQLATIDAQLATKKAQIRELETSTVSQEIKAAQAEAGELSKKIRSLKRAKEDSSKESEKKASRQADIKDLRKRQQEEQTTLRKLRQEIAKLQQKQKSIEEGVAKEEKKLPFGLLPGPQKGEEAGVTGKLRDLKPQPPWSEFKS
jgi:hypothetical protein